jgi:hypothetical protein
MQQKDIHADHCVFRLTNEERDMRLNWRPSGRPGEYVASTPIGVYKLMDLPLGCAVGFHSTHIPFFDINSKPGVTLQQAKELAEKDFEQRRESTLASLQKEDPRLKSGMR